MTGLRQEGAAIALFFITVLALVIGASRRERIHVAQGRKAPQLNETPFVESRLPTVS